LGTIIGRRLRKQGLLPDGIRSSDLGNIVAAASLAHDMGNPPFGHSGEAAIQNWFAKSETANRVKEHLMPQQILELANYEGNAHAFRLVTRLLSSNHVGGLQLTFATLGSLVKYPIGAHAALKEMKGKISAKKFNFFETERSHFTEVAVETGLLRKPGRVEWWCRHPLAFVSEAADDIAYRIVDLEDGYHMNCISYEITANALKRLITDARRKTNADRIVHEKEKIAYLRSIAITQLVEEAAEKFFEKYDAILCGQYEKSLLNRIPSENALKTIRELTLRHIYTDQRVLSVEVAGFEIIYQLMERFACAAIDKLECRNSEKKLCVQSEKVLGLLPVQYQRYGDRPLTKYYDLLLCVADFVAGMTDSYAVDLFQKISGQKFVT
jgi:dGTPase